MLLQVLQWNFNTLHSWHPRALAVIKKQLLVRIQHSGLLQLQVK